MENGIGGTPYKHPEVRKKIPQPFRRPSINAGGQSVKRAWRDTVVHRIVPGDTVAEFGIVAEAAETLVDHFWTIRLTNVLGQTRDFNGHARVFAFSPES